MTEETAKSVYYIANALNQYSRKNETFWKVFGNILSKVKENYKENELINLTAMLEATNG